MSYQLTYTGERHVPWSSDYVTGYEHVHRYLLACQYAKNKRTLDVSCGEGYGTAMLAQRARSVIGVDIDLPTVEHARQYHARRNIEFRHGDAQHLDLPPQSVDLAVSFETIEHFAGHDPFLEGIKHALTSEGLLIISTPSREAYSDDADQQNPFHVRELYREEFLALLQKYFAHVQLFGQSPMASSVITRTDDRIDLRSNQTGRFLVTEVDASRLDYSAEVHTDWKPRYYLAFCSDTPLPNVSTTVLADSNNTLWDHFIGMESLRDERDQLALRVEEFTQTLAAKDLHIESQSNHIESQSAYTENLIEALAEKDRHIESQDIHIQSQSAYIEDLTQAIAVKDRHIESQDKYIENQSAHTEKQQQRIEELVQAITAKDLHIENQSAHIETQQARIEELTQALAAKDLHIESQGNYIDEQRRFIERLALALREQHQLSSIEQ